jgi:HAE1 family hydrophobic/amphiphilic exporter-1
MKIVDFSIQRRVTVTMFMVAAIIFGYVGFTRLPINLLPDITYPTLTVRTEYPGAAPVEVERLISEPIEGVVGVVPNVVKVSSISRPGVSDVVVEFGWGTNMDFAALDVREKLDLVNLPRDSRKPVLLRFDPSLDPIMRVGVSGDVSLTALRLMAEEDIKPELESLDGVAAVKVSGGMEEEIHVDIQEAKLASLGIPINQVTARLEQENVNLTGGALKDGEAEYLVRTLNEFKTVDEIQDIVVGERNGAVVTLGDVGVVRRGSKERDVITRINGREAVEIAVYKEGDANAVGVARHVWERLNRLRVSGEAAAARLEVVFDQSKFIQQAVDEVKGAAWEGGILALAILYFFLKDVKSTAIISTSIPISVMMTFFVMYISGISLNTMSLGGLALGVGMVVDDAIVVLESIQRYRDQGYSAMEAASVGTGEVGLAVSATTLTTVCVFVPIVFVEGVAGQLFRDQALTITYSLLASWVGAITLIPMLSSLQIGRQEAEGRPSPLHPSPTSGRGEASASEPGRGPISDSPALPLSHSPTRSSAFTRGLMAALRGVGAAAKGGGWLLNLVLSPFMYVFDKVFGVVQEGYPRLLRWAIGHRLRLVAGAAGVLALAVLGLMATGTELMPEVSQGEFFIDVKMPVGTPLAVTDRTVQAMAEVVQGMPETRMVYSMAGAGGASSGAAGEERENIGQIHVMLKRGVRRAQEEAIMDRLRSDFARIPSAEYNFSRLSYFSFKTPIEVQVSGYNLRQLQDLSHEVTDRLSHIAGLTDVKSSTEGGNPEVQITFNRKKVASLGTTISAIATLLRNKIQGEVATEFMQKDRRIDVLVRASEGERTGVESIRRLSVSPPNASTQVPLASVADVRVEPGPAEIRRIDQQRVALVTANLVGRDLGSAVEDIRRAVAQIPLPADFSVTVGGQSEEMATSFESMRFAIILAIFLVYLVMASQFESLLHPFVIMFSIPFGLVGVAVALLLTGGTVSVMVLIGLIMLAGIVVKNAILLIDYTNHARRQGVPKEEAVVQAGQVRLRPILMTTGATVLGLLPMALGLGEGAELRQPMAVTVIGGLTISTMLTLVLIPVIYVMMDRRK